MSGTPPADPPENGPAGDAFYVVHKMVPPGDPGDPIYQRRLDNPTAALNGSNWLALYRSDDAHGNPIAVSGMIVLPNQPPKTADGYPLISWAHGTVGVAHMCAPSRDRLESDAHPVNVYPQDLLNNFLSQGWAVAMTDYEGLGVTYGRHPYMLGRSEAHGVLDIVRTARELFGERISGRFAIVGHSQGGQAALFAAHHAPGRVDGLVGVAAIAPANHPLDVITGGARNPFQDPGRGYAFTPLFLAGALGGDPRIRAEEVLSPNWAMPHWPEVDELCRAGLSKGAWGDMVGNQQFKRKGLGVLPTYPGDPNEHQGWFNEQLKEMNPNLPIGVPIRISQSADDERVKAQTIEEEYPVVGTITVRGTDELVAELLKTNEDCTPGLLYRRYPPNDNDTDDRVPVPEHELGVHFATINHDAPALTAWLGELFDGGG